MGEIMNPEKEKVAGKLDMAELYDRMDERTMDKLLETFSQIDKERERNKSKSTEKKEKK
jgi:hypothetical protein